MPAPEKLTLVWAKTRPRRLGGYCVSGKSSFPEGAES